MSGPSFYLFFLLFAHDGRIKYRVNTNRKPDDDITSAANETLRFERDKDVRDGTEKKRKVHDGFRALASGYNGRKYE